jgi:hypothetical protein
MIVIGAHRINKGSINASICKSIAEMSALIPGRGTIYGTGAYAYYADSIPHEMRDDPFVIFEPSHQHGQLHLIDLLSSGFITKHGTSVPDRRFFLLPGRVDVPIKVAILGFVNCPPELPKYPGMLYYV